MQFCQPPFQPTGFPNLGQPCGFNAPTPNQLNGFPDIIGEGDVVSTISPDGSTRLLFFPTVQWPQWRTFPQNPYVGNLNNPYINTLGAWFVRNMFNPLQPTVFSQPHQECFTLQYPRASASDCCLNLSPPGLPLKFHSDTSTSTTDMHYFVPKQFNWFRCTTGCASVQVACPVQTTATACDYELSCTKPCNCTPTQPCNCDIKDETKKQNAKCMCFKIKKSNSQMSIDSRRSTHSRSKCKSHRSKSKKSKNSRHKCECNEFSTSGSDKSMSKLSNKSSCGQMSVDSRSSHNRRKEKLRKSKRSKAKKSRHKCECKEPTASDKCVTTYADQGNGCVPDRGRETQTSCCSIPIIKVSKEACNSMCHRAKIWSAKSCSSKNAMSQSTCFRGKSSDSISSCCTSETGRE